MIKRILAILVIAAVFLAGQRIVRVVLSVLHPDPSAMRITQVVSNEDTVTVDGETSNTRYRLVCHANDRYSVCFFPESGKVYHVEVIGEGYAVMKEMDNIALPFHNFKIESEEGTK